MSAELTIRVIRHIAAFRRYKSGRLLDTLYGKKALPLRTQIAAMILDRKVTGSDPAAQWNRLRSALLCLIGATGECTASLNADFEEKAERLLSENELVGSK